MNMRLPCAVVRDLLPLYAEKMTEEETTQLIAEHIEDCTTCRQKLAEIDTGIRTPVESVKPLLDLKKEIRKYRWFSVAVAALLVFVTVYTFCYHTNKMELVPWQDGLVEVEGIETRPYGDVYADAEPSGASESTVDVLVLKVNGLINGTQVSSFMEDGTRTMILEGWSFNQGSNVLTGNYSKMELNPAPDRLLYSDESQSQLLWGEPMNGGVIVLPRLALGYYVIAAAGAVLVLGAVWFFLRNRKSSWIPRQLFFAPVSYVIAHFLIKGTRTVSFFMERDFLSIVLVTIALYAMFSLAWQIWLQRRKAI